MNIGIATKILEVDEYGRTKRSSTMDWRGEYKKILGFLIPSPGSWKRLLGALELHVPNLEIVVQYHVQFHNSCEKISL